MLRKLLLVTTAVATAVTGTALAAEPDSYYPSKGDGRVNVTRYSLDLTWKPKDQTLVGTATLRLRATEPSESLTLDLHRAMKVRSVTVDGVAVAAVHDGNDLLVPGPLVPGALAPTTVVVKYAGRPRTVPAPTSRSDSTGLGWHTTDSGRVWTMQKPYGGFTWYPVNDQPSDKALYDVRLDVPGEWVGVSNGRLVDRRSSGGRTITRFSSGDPLPAHLVTVAVGPYRKVTDEGPQGLPLTYWLPKGREDLLGPLRKTPQALAWLEKRLGPYPFDSAGVVVTPGRGSVESATMITLSLDDYRYGSHDVREQVAHALVHSWYGASVSPRDWRDNWMAESMATYLQARFAVSRGWDTWSYWEREFARNDQFWRDLYGPPGAYDRDEFGQRNVHYGGALILDRLRAQIGAATFDEAMAGWPAANAHTSRDRGDYIAYLSDLTGRDLGPWMRDWLTNERTPTS